MNKKQLCKAVIVTFVTLGIPYFEAKRNSHIDDEHQENHTALQGLRTSASVYNINYINHIPHSDVPARLVTFNL
jgi:hypothetical protein